MRLLFIRHGDPDYAIDGLTQQGQKEALALAERLQEEKIDFLYCSPLGRAKRTAWPYLKSTGRKAVILPWLQEFNHPCQMPQGVHTCCWDWLPQDLQEKEDLFSKDWLLDPAYEGEARESVREVFAAFDGLLAKHGYRKDGRYYRVEQANHDTLCFFCHFGIESLLLSRLLDVSPLIFWQGTAAAPASVTTVYSEERREGLASFRIQSFGDVSHLAKKGYAPSFSARFCECFSDDTRHD